VVTKMIESVPVNKERHDEESRMQRHKPRNNRKEEDAPFIWGVVVGFTALAVALVIIAIAKGWF
jgi:hypothetical protein